MVDLILDKETQRTTVAVPVVFEIFNAEAVFDSDRMSGQKGLKMAFAVLGAGIEDGEEN